MYKSALVAVCGGTLCQATGDNPVTIITRENGRLIRRKMLPAGGKIFGARTVSYADAYFSYPFGSVEILGEEEIYADTASTVAQD